MPNPIEHLEALLSGELNEDEVLSLQTQEDSIFQWLQFASHRINMISGTRADFLFPSWYIKNHLWQSRLQIACILLNAMSIAYLSNSWWVVGFAAFFGFSFISSVLKASKPIQEVQMPAPFVLPFYGLYLQVAIWGCFIPIVRYVYKLFGTIEVGTIGWLVILLFALSAQLNFFTPIPAIDPTRMKKMLALPFAVNFERWAIRCFSDVPLLLWFSAALFDLLGFISPWFYGTCCAIMFTLVHADRYNDFPMQNLNSRWLGFVFGMSIALVLAGMPAWWLGDGLFADAWTKTGTISLLLCFTAYGYGCGPLLVSLFKFQNGWQNIRLAAISILFYLVIAIALFALVASTFDLIGIRSYGMLFFTVLAVAFSSISIAMKILRKSANSNISLVFQAIASNPLLQSPLGSRGLTN